MNQMISILRERNGSTVKELAECFQVSEMTIRRDLSVLDSKNIVNNVFGATIYNPGNTLDSLEKDYSLDKACITMDSEKTKIGQKAASLIAENEIVIIDTGSTTEKLANAIPFELKASIYCYNLNIMNILAGKKNLNLSCAGGHYHANTQMMESKEGISFIHSMRANKAFISAAGIHESLGVTCATSYESPTKQAVISSAAENILLADSSKFDVIKASYFAPITQFDLIITDQGIPMRWKELIQSAGIQLMIV